MAFVRGLIAAAASLILETGFGHAAMLRPRRAFAWLGAAVGAIALIPVTICALPLVVAGHLAAVIDTFVVGYRTTAAPPFRWIQKWTIAVFVTVLASLVALRAFVVEAFMLPF